MLPEDFFAKLRAYCDHFAASVTSYGRTPAHNRAVGGVTNSPHLAWLAADLVYDTRPDELDATDFATLIGIRLIREQSHDHLQPLDWAAG